MQRGPLCRGVALSLVFALFVASAGCGGTAKTRAEWLGFSGAGLALSGAALQTTAYVLAERPGDPSPAIRPLNITGGVLELTGLLLAVWALDTLIRQSSNEWGLEP